MAMNLPKLYYHDEESGITIYNADCREILPYLPKVDLVLTDPPYGIGYSSGHGSDLWGDGAIQGDQDISTRDGALTLCGECGKIVFGTWRRPKPEGTRMVLIWDTLGALGMGDLSLPWKPSHQEIYILGSTAVFGGVRSSDVIRHAPVQSMAANGRVHPFEKPVGLIHALLNKTTAQTILDPFMGSGTTLVAAKNLGRKCIGIEIEEKYCAIAVERLAQGNLFGGAA